MNTLSKFASNLSLNIIFALCLSIPAFFLTTTTDFFDFNKFSLLVVGVLILMVVSLIGLYAKNELVLTSSSVSIPLFLFAVSTIITAVVNSPNKVESLLSPQGAGGIIILTLWFFMLISIVRAKDISWIVRAFIISGAVLAALALLQLMGLGLNRVFGDQSYYGSRFWTPAGSLLTLVMFLVALFPIVLIKAKEKITHYLESDRKGSPMPAFGAGALLILYIISTLVILSQLVFSTRPVLMPFGAGWTVTLESLKNVQRALLGVGSGNYIFAYTTGKPAFMNLNDYWNIRFLSAPNWYMQMIVEIGLIGFGVYIMLVLGVLKKMYAYVIGLKKKTYRYDGLFLGVILSLFIILLQQLILPANFLQMFLLYTLLGIVSLYVTTNAHVEKSKILSFIIIGLGALFVAFTSYVTYRAYAAEVYMKMSVDASLKNNASDTYTYQTRAIQANPYIDRYRVVFSQTNLALATALSNKKDLTDKEKVDVITLLTQTTNEGKSAIFNNPTNVQNWENLARVYKTMVNQVKDADKWSLQAYQQSIALDPLNPMLRLEVGGVFYSIKNYDAAIQVFQETAALKPDWANAYYNLALALREKKDFANASAAMQRSIDLLPKDSPDKPKAETELASIKEQIPAAPTVAGAQTGDQPAASPAASPSLTLPENAAPDNAINQAQSQQNRLAPQPSATPQPEQ